VYALSYLTVHLLFFYRRSDFSPDSQMCFWIDLLKREAK